VSRVITVDERAFGTVAALQGGKIFIELVALGEGLIHIADFGDRPRIRHVDVKRRVECSRNSIAGG
jgi:hypothetical protein